MVGLFVVLLTASVIAAVLKCKLGWCRVDLLSLGPKFSKCRTLVARIVKLRTLQTHGVVSCVTAALFD